MHISNKMVEPPLLMRSKNFKQYVLKAMVYVIDTNVVFLCGNKTLEFWGANLDMRNRIMETSMEGENLGYNMIKTVTMG